MFGISRPTAINCLRGPSTKWLFLTEKKFWNSKKCVGLGRGTSQFFNQSANGIKFWRENIHGLYVVHVKTINDMDVLIVSMALISSNYLLGPPSFNSNASMSYYLRKAEKICYCDVPLPIVSQKNLKL
ncbi:unnamed protein product [Meganyctiphanes norvegica]|uniref:Uncharacterized protein n=1 Tax=Meganyctiphanes norvegica TaxID=48144 RepID=A0AAV2SQJ3_MEGNR